jgi:hypothetical protein
MGLLLSQTRYEPLCSNVQGIVKQNERAEVGSSELSSEYLVWANRECQGVKGLSLLKEVRHAQIYWMIHPAYPTT